MKPMSKKYNYENSIKSSLFMLIYTIPYVVVAKTSSFVVQIETLIFLLFAGITIFEWFNRRTSIIATTKYTYTILFVWSLLIMTLWSLLHTSDYFLSQMQQSAYWTISLFPLIFIKDNIKLKFNAIKATIWASLIGATIVIVLKFSLESYYRSFGFINNANLAGALFALAFLLNFGIYLQNKKRFNLFVAFINILAVFATGSRESLLSIIIGTVLMFFLGGDKKSKRLLKKSILVLVGVLISVFILEKYFPEMIVRYKNTIMRLMSWDYYEVNAALSGRPIIWNEIFDYLKSNIQRPLGFDGLRAISSGSYAHNMLLQAWVIGGVFGLFIFIGWLLNLVNILYTNYKRKQDIISITLIIIYISYVVTGVVSDHFLNFYLWNLVFFSILKQSINEV